MGQRTDIPLEVEVFHLSDVSKKFEGHTVFKDLTLSVSAGDFLSILGPSGCGKSTILRIIAGLEPISSGEFIWGRSFSTASLSYVFQEPQLLPWRNITENISLPLELQNREVSSSRVDETLTWLGLKEFSHLKPHQLSGGMKMRVSIARALMTEPRILLLDEPFAALDELTRERLDQDLFEIWKIQKLTVIFVTHSMSEAVLLSSRIFVMGKTPSPEHVQLPADRSPSLRWTPEFGQEVGRFSQILRSSP